MPKRTQNVPLPHLANEKELNQFLLDALGKNLEQAIRSTVSILVKTEMRELREQLWKEKQEHLVFNGSYPRHLVSRAGKVEAIPIPRFRSGNEGLELASMKIFGEERERFNELVAHLHLAGVSQRKVNRFCKNLFGKAVAPSTTKEVFEELLEAEAFQVNKTSLLGLLFDFLFVDGIWETVRSEKTGETRKRVTLAVLGMKLDGTKQLLGFRLAFEEDEASWMKLLQELQHRGLDLTQTKLVIADGGTGCLSALERLMPDVPVQSCLTHRYRNVLKHTGFRHKPEMGRDLKKLTQARSKADFLKHVGDMQKRWQTIAPEAIKSLIRNLESSTTYFSFPEELWSKLRTTNALERTFREVRARTRVHYDHYESPQSSDKYHNAIFGNINKTYFHVPSTSTYTQ